LLFLVGELKDVEGWAASLLNSFCSLNPGGVGWQVLVTVPALDKVVFWVLYLLMLLKLDIKLVFDAGRRNNEL
jgi:hypothetical protein